MAMATLFKKGTGEARDFPIEGIIKEEGWYLTREQAIAAGEQTMLPRGHNGVIVLAPFIKDQEFWCTCCDAKVVDSNDEATGHFYVSHGHARTKDVKAGEGMKVNPEYVQFVIALCPECEAGHFIHTKEKA